MAGVRVELPDRVIDHADERAAFFFATNISSVGANAYDARTGTEPDSFTEDDLTLINRTMMARTAHKHWTDFTGASGQELAWLQALRPDWDLIAMSGEEWSAANCERHITTALEQMMGRYRRAATVTKLLHLKRPRLIPICDSYVASILGHNPLDVPRASQLIAAVRDVGRDNRAALEEVSARLRSLGIERSLIRILDALLWSSYRPGGAEIEFDRLLHEHYPNGFFFAREHIASEIAGSVPDQVPRA